MKNERHKSFNGSTIDRDFRTSSHLSWFSIGDNAGTYEHTARRQRRPDQAPPAASDRGASSDCTQVETKRQAQAVVVHSSEQGRSLSLGRTASGRGGSSAHEPRWSTIDLSNNQCCQPPCAGDRQQQRFVRPMRRQHNEGRRVREEEGAAAKQGCGNDRPAHSFCDGQKNKWFKM
jgi:hypothetical protein